MLSDFRLPSLAYLFLVALVMLAWGSLLQEAFLGLFRMGLAFPWVLPGAKYPVLCPASPPAKTLRPQAQLLRQRRWGMGGAS